MGAAVLRGLGLLLAAVLAMWPALSVAHAGAPTVIPVGKAVGIKLFSDGVVVVGTSDIATDGGSVNPAKACGLREGDIITHINSTEVDTIEEVSALLQELEGETMSIRAIRDDKQVQLTATAALCASDGAYKLGAWIRDSMAGIGTVTFYCPGSGAFGALGHGINDVDTAKLMPLDDGGVFGVMADSGWVEGTAVEAAAREEAVPGPATILCNISGEWVEEYAIEIAKVFPQREDDCRDYLLKVTDPRLLDATGGIVQGMSGSPILQNGKIVGAVTHVLVDDPTSGYGIYVGRMLRQTGAV